MYRAFCTGGTTHSEGSFEGEVIGQGLLSRWGRWGGLGNFTVGAMTWNRQKSMKCLGCELCDPVALFIDACIMSTDILDRLMAQLHQRAVELPEGSYTTKLVLGGLSKMGGKLVEEVFELVEASREQGIEGRQHTIREACDVLYHMMVILATRQISIDELRAELEGREGVSGIVEKQNRQKEAGQ